MRIGCIGTGTMGAWMALNVRKAGYELAVHDLRKETATAVVAAGATWADSVAAIGKDADVNSGFISHSPARGVDS